MNQNEWVVAENWSHTMAKGRASPTFPPSKHEPNLVPGADYVRLPVTIGGLSLTHAFDRDICKNNTRLFSVVP